MLEKIKTNNQTSRDKIQTITNNQTQNKRKFDLEERTTEFARREAKETCHWLILLNEANPGQEKEFRNLIQEATEYKKILSSIIRKAE